VTDLGELLRRGDLDGLVREIDRRAALEDWRGVIDVRDACRAATEETGTQLWGPAQYADYRVALDAPAPIAASVVTPGAGRFGLGPLTEVIAQEHRFAELAPHLDPTLLPIVAQERVLRGEDLTHRLVPEALAPPLRLEPFEPAYALPTYRPSERLDGGPVVDPQGAVTIGPAGDDGAPDGADRLVPPGLDRALTELVGTWTSQSTGEVRLAVSHDVRSAIASVVRSPVRWWPVGTRDALAHLAFAGASGGVHGRRRGGAAGRAGAWWVAACATALPVDASLDDGGLDADELEFRLEDLEVSLFAPLEGPTSTWSLRVAIADPSAGWAIALEAEDHDARIDGELERDDLRPTDRDREEDR
jgi:hypothetical protein